jgi:hypothetical protein
MTESRTEESWQVEEPWAAARGISLGIALGGLLWTAAILALRTLV